MAKKDVLSRCWSVMNSGRVALVLFLGLWLFLMIGQRSSCLGDPSTYMHIRTGALILAEGTLPQQDRYSISAFGEPWIAQQWLGEIVMALLFRVGEYDALLLATSTLLALLYTWLFISFCRGGMHPLPGLLFLVLVLGASSHHFLARPHLFSILGMATTVVVLLEVESGRKPLQYLLALLPVYLLWTNIHGGVLGGMASLGFVFLGWVLNLPLGGPTPLRGDAARRIAWLGAASLAIGLTPLINPYGLQLPRTWLGIMDSPAVSRFMIEHAPLLTFWYGWLTILLGIVYLAFVAGWGNGGFSPIRYLPLVWLVLAYSRVRHAPLFAVAAGFALADGYARTVWIHCLEARGSALFRRLPPSASDGWKNAAPPVVVAALLLFMTGLACQAAGLALPVIGKGWARLDTGHWPADLLPRIRAWSETKPVGEPIFNDFLFGGFLIGHVPRLRVFIDDRCELYQDRRLSEYVELGKTPALIEGLEQRFHFTGALVKRGTPAEQWFRTRPGWQSAGEGEAAVWFEKP